jgi:hypothetical protein
MVALWPPLPKKEGQGKISTKRVYQAGTQPPKVLYTIKPEIYLRNPE